MYPRTYIFPYEHTCIYAQYIILMYSYYILDYILYTKTYIIICNMYLFIYYIYYYYYSAYIYIWMLVKMTDFVVDKGWNTDMVEN